MYPTNKLLVAYDFSESTVDNRFYHQTVQKVLSQYETYDVILWSNKLKVSSPEELKRINSILDGQGGTCPKLIAEHLITSDYTDLVIITDGQIFERYVKELDDFLDKNILTVKHLECYLIQTSPEKFDATVIAPFLRRVPHIVYLYNEGVDEPQLLTQGSKSAQDFIDMLRTITTIEEFESKYETLFTEVVSKMLGKVQDLQMKDEILNLQKRLIYEMKMPIEGVPNERLIKLFNENFGNNENFENVEKSSIIMEQMTNDMREVNEIYHQKYKDITWPPKLFHLLRMCSGNLGSVFSLSALTSKFQADRVRRADVVEQIELGQIPVKNNENNGDDDTLDNLMNENETGISKFVCPISYEEEDDVMLMIVKPTEGLLAHKDPNMINMLITNPFNAIMFPDFLKQIALHLDHPISLRSVKEAEELGKPITTSPLTRKSLIHGGLCLSASEEHCNMTNYTLAQLFSEGKRAGNLDFWFCIIWYLVENNYVPHLIEILPQIRQHMLYRLKNHWGTMSLKNVPYFCVTKMPLGIGILFTLCSNMCGMDKHKALEHLRPHSYHIKLLLRLAEMMKFKIPKACKDFILKFLEYYYIEKTIKKEKYETVDNFLRLSYQCIPITSIPQKGFGKHIKNKYVLNPKFVPIDGVKTIDDIRNNPEENTIYNKMPWFIREINITELRIMTKVLQIFDLQKISFENMFQDRELFTDISWPVYGEKKYEIPEVPICPLTMRPFTKVNSLPWNVISEKTFGPLNDQIHIHYLYITYVRRFQSFPTYDDLLAYVYHLYVPLKVNSLPHMISEFAICAVTGYNAVFAEKKVNPSEFNKLTDYSGPIVRRELLENKYNENYLQ